MPTNHQPGTGAELDLLRGFREDVEHAFTVEAGKVFAKQGWVLQGRDKIVDPALRAAYHFRESLRERWNDVVALAKAHNRPESEIKPMLWLWRYLDGDPLSDIERRDVLDFIDLLILRVQRVQADGGVGSANKAALKGVPFVPTPLQHAILKALQHQALKKDPLAAKVCAGDASRLYKPGGIKELRDEGMVDHKHGVGFYRPDAPPVSP